MALTGWVNALLALMSFTFHMTFSFNLQDLRTAFGTKQVTLDINKQASTWLCFVTPDQFKNNIQLM